jgi:hypothetical protein
MSTMTADQLEQLVQAVIGSQLEPAAKTTMIMSLTDQIAVVI